VHAVVSDEIESLTSAVERAVAVAKTEGFAKSGEYIVVTAGVPVGRSGTTNVLRVATVD